MLSRPATFAARLVISRQCVLCMLVLAQANQRAKAVGLLAIAVAARITGRLSAPTQERSVTFATKSGT